MSSFFAKPLLWNGFVRIILFWAIVGLVVWGLLHWLAPLGLSDVWDIVDEAFHGTMDRVSTRTFAFTLATTIGALAAGLLVSHLFCDMILIRLALRAMRTRVSSLSDSRAFTAQRDRLRTELEAHPLLGHAWTEFDETLVPHDDGLHNTIRPQTFFNLATLREKVSGLKWQSAEPGYFVGVGLLLTFVGLVIALSKAAASTGAANADDMRHALEALLQAATFKFSTSIAGLAASILLSLVYKFFSIGIESSLHRFCEEMEHKLLYLPPQSVSVAMRDHLSEQLTQLKEINSEAFFNKLGTEVAPRMQEAFSSAVTPLAERIGDAVGQLNATSQDGVQELLTRFTDTLQNGAGTEMRELTNGLHAMLGAMEKVRSDMGRSGDDFSQKMTDAAENLNRLVAEAGRQLGAQSQTSRETLEQMLASLREIFEQATKQIDVNLKGAAEGASTKLTEAMDRVLDKLEGNVGGLNKRFQGFNEQAASYIDETCSKVAEAQESSISAISQASVRAAAALEKGLGEAMKGIRDEVEGFSSALRQSSASLDGQAKAINAATLKSREVADVFGRSAEAVKAAIDPVTRSNEKIAQVTSTVGTALEQAGAALGEGQKAAKDLTEAVNAQVHRLTGLWADYQQRFAQIDEKLARAFEKLGEETSKQSQILATRTGEIDTALAKSVDQFHSVLSTLSDNSEDIAESLAKFADGIKANGAPR